MKLTRATKKSHLDRQGFIAGKNDLNQKVQQVLKSDAKFAEISEQVFFLLVTKKLLFDGGAIRDFVVKESEAKTVFKTSMSNSWWR